MLHAGLKWAGGRAYLPWKAAGAGASRAETVDLSAMTHGCRLRRASCCWVFWGGCASLSLLIMRKQHVLLIPHAHAKHGHTLQWFRISIHAQGPATPSPSPPPPCARRCLAVRSTSGVPLSNTDPAPAAASAQPVSDGGSADKVWSPDFLTNQPLSKIAHVLVRYGLVLCVRHICQT